MVKMVRKCIGDGAEEQGELTNVVGVGEMREAELEMMRQKLWEDAMQRWQRWEIAKAGAECGRFFSRFPLSLPLVYYRLSPSPTLPRPPPRFTMRVEFTAFGIK